MLSLELRQFGFLALQRCCHCGCTGCQGRYLGQLAAVVALQAGKHRLGLAMIVVNRFELGFPVGLQLAQVQIFGLEFGFPIGIDLAEVGHLCLEAA